MKLFYPEHFFIDLKSTKFSYNSIIDFKVKNRIII